MTDDKPPKARRGQRRKDSFSFQREHGSADALIFLFLAPVSLRG